MPYDLPERQNATTKPRGHGMANVFISYASEDRNRVRPLAEALQARGFSVWWDRALGAGQDYTSVIEKELREAKAVIVVWTRGSALSTFVRDEAGRARDEGRLIPVIFDPVQIPLGFGAFQAEDFTKWNGGANAPQMQILEEALRAKLEGREQDGGAVARKRRKLMARVRIVSVLTVIALIVGIAVGGRYLIDPPRSEVTQEDLRAELLRLLADGTLTPDQAIQLAALLKTGALGEETQLADNAPEGAAPAPGAGMETRSMTADGGVSEATFTAAASETYDAAMLQLFSAPDQNVRVAAAQMADPAQRDAAIQTLWNVAQTTDDVALRTAIYQVCGAVGEANNHPLAQQALERAVDLAPADVRNWQLLSRSLERTGNGSQAQAAALVSEAVVAQEAGQSVEAEAALEQALPNLPTNNGRAFVASQLGELAEQRQDYSAAAARFDQAVQARTEAVESAPAAAPAIQAELQADATGLVRNLQRSGRLQEACRRAREVQEETHVDAADAQLSERCATLFRMQVRPGVQLQRSDAQQIQPRTDLQRQERLQRAPVVTPAPAEQ